MSLLDALLLEPYRDPREVWIALRADGQRGSGTIDDPFHAGVLETPQLRSTLGLVVGTNPREILATTAGPHGYIEGDVVVLSDTRDVTLLILNRTAPIWFDYSGMVSCVNNRTPQDTLIKANDLATAQLIESYFPAAEDALVLAL